jgi:hypothetical protein
MTRFAPIGRALVCGALAAACQAAFSQSVFQINPDSAKSFINPGIYGFNTVPCTQDNINTFLPKADLKAERIGGNRLTGYNWENNASNAGSDWNQNSDNHLMNNPVATAQGPGGTMITFMDRCKNLNLYSTIQLPLAGYVAADMNGSVGQEQSAPSSRWKKVVFRKGSSFSSTPSMTDSVVYVDEFVNFMVQKYGKASDGGVKSYCLDNEPGLWNGTHPRIHPQAPTIAEIVAKAGDCAKAVKAVDPSVEILGMEVFGWMEFLNCSGATDWDSYKNTYDWGFGAYLGEMKKLSDSFGKRLLDVATVHWYPEAKGDVRICSDSVGGSESTIQARLQAPRSLWDTTYKETSWVADNTGGPIYLLPRLFKSINKWYPGTKLGITEYTYGGAVHISGGLALVDVLGIFGSRGVYVANLHEALRGYLKSAFLLYQNFDGKFSAYGDTSVAASSPKESDYSVFASTDAKRSKLLHVIFINKKSTASSITLQIKGSKQYRAGIVYGFTGDSSGIARLADVGTINSNTVAYTAPGYSALHFILSTDETVDLQAPSYYTLSVTTLGNGKVLRSVDGARLSAGTQVTLTAVPDSGWIFSGWAGADSSKNAAISMTMNGDKTLQARFSSAAEMIPNGDFSNDVANWTVSTWSPDGSAQGQASVVNGALKYIIQNGGTDAWNVQIFQNSVPYIKGTTYTLSFTAWAEASRTLNVYAAKGALDKKVNLSTTQSTFTFTFTADSTDAAGRLSFDFGGNGAAGAGVAYLDDVSMKAQSVNAIKTAAAFCAGANSEVAVFTGKGAPVVIPFAYSSGPISLSLCDLSGKTIAVIYRGAVTARRMEIRLTRDCIQPGLPMGSGTYLISLQARNASKAFKLVLK